MRNLLRRHTFTLSIKNSKKTMLVFIKRRHDFTEQPYHYAVNAAEIKTLEVSSTYDQFGQLVSHEDAGDCIELVSEKAVRMANETRGEVFQVGDMFTAMEENFDDLLGELSEGEDYVKYFPTVEGFNYWDGNNNRSILVDGDGFEQDWEMEIESDKKTVASLKRICKSTERGDGLDDRGITTYTRRNGVVKSSRWAGHWWQYKIELC